MAIFSIVAALNIGVFVLGLVALPRDKWHGLIVVMLGLLPVGLIGLGIIISLWRRYPVTDERDKQG